MPKAELKETVGCSKKFHVEVEPERIDEQMKSTVKSVGREVQLPGFRKGKAPEALLLRRFGVTIRQEAVRELIPKVIEEVFETEGIEAVGEPEVGDVDFGETGPVTFTVTVEELPDIDIDAFQGIKVTKEAVEITDADIDEEIERIRRIYAERGDVERGAEKNDILVVNLQKLTSSGVPIIGEKMENHVIALDGEDTPSPEFDEQVLGMKAGETRNVRFTYDESINNPDLVGQTEYFEVEVLRVVEVKIPELDGELLEKIPGEFESVDDFRAKTRERLERQAESAAKRALHADLIDEFVRENPFEVPHKMVKRVIQSEMQRYWAYNPNVEIDENAFAARIRGDAVKVVQSYIILEAVEERQNIEVTKEELDERIRAVAALNQMEYREYRRRLIKEGGLEEFKRNIARDKAYDWIVGVADIEEKTVRKTEKKSNIIMP